MDEEETQFLQRICKLPSSFSLIIDVKTTSKEIDAVKKKLQLKCEVDELESDTERTRMYNLLSFLHWKADEKDKAYEHNRKVLELQETNIVALCNRIWILRKDGRLTKADEKLNEVENLVECNQDLRLQGRAEIAYSYSAFGPFYFSQSLEMYTQLLDEVGNTEIAAKDLQLWKLDLGIIYRKYCNSANILPKQDWKERNRDDFIKKAAVLFNEVISSNCPARWKGRCIASLAELSYSIYTGVGVEKNQVELFPKEFADKDVESLLDLALETFKEDSHVLKVCGKHFRYLQNLDKAEKVLRISLNLRETSGGHHHLALVLKKKLTFRINENGRRHQRNNKNKSCMEKCKSRSREIKPGDAIVPSEEMTHSRKASHPDNQHLAERSGNYTNNLSPTSVNTSTSKTNYQNMKWVEGGVELTSPARVCDPQEQLPSLLYLRFDTDKPQIKPELYQNMKKALAKSFSRVFHIPETENEAVKDILYHLDKAIEFGNEWASVDKGIVLRQVKEHKKAFESFVKTLNMKGLSTTMITVSCYEHLGFCCRDIAEDEVNPEEKRTFISDSIKYFRKAIETIAHKASNELDYLKDASMAYPTLKDMFKSQKGGITMLKELAEVSKMLDKYGESLDFYKQIKEKDTEQLKNPAIIHGEIEILLAKGEFEQAAVLLDLQNCTQAKNEMSKEFCKLVYLECAFHLVHHKQHENASKRFRQAFDICCTEIPRKNTDFDIFFLSDEKIDTNEAESPSFAFKVARLLSDNVVPEECGLRITGNSDNVKPGRSVRNEQTKQMDSSIHIVLILNSNDKPQGEFEYFIDIAQEIEKKKTSKLSLINFDECACPIELSVFPKMSFDTKLFQCEDNFIDWIHKFFVHLLGICGRKQ
ncbi:hypothetical protein ACJMK2_027639 [Sinanodonta woodiana]|uniref:Uncharacterized protein n=1 Tax=Sinanodonta woodiana TaxID=1069815 RepID=A0ABD3X848_SINWO